MKHIFDTDKLAQAKLPCATCNGHGTIKRTILYGRASADMVATCPTCRGKGYVHHHNGFPVLTCDIPEDARRSR